MLNDISAPPDQLAERAQSLMAVQPYFRGASYPLSYESFERVLVVTGRVPSFYLKQVLQTELARLEGIDRIVNHVVVDYSRFGS